MTVDAVKGTESLDILDYQMETEIKVVVNKGYCSLLSFAVGLVVQMLGAFAIEITDHFVLLVIAILIYSKMLSNVDGNRYYSSGSSTIEND